MLSLKEAIRPLFQSERPDVDAILAERGLALIGISKAKLVNIGELVQNPSNGKWVKKRDVLKPQIGEKTGFTHT